MTKPCSKCGRDLSLSEFSPDKRMNLGVGSQCKECNRSRMKNYGGRASVKRKRSAYNREYRKKNHKKLATANRKWRRINAARISAKRRAAYPEKRDELIAYQATYRDANRRKINSRQRRYHARNRDVRLEQNREWRRKNPDKLRAHIKNRRAKKLGAREGGLTATEWRRICEVYEHRCVYCGDQPARLTQDHVIPLCKGGSHTKENVVPACQPCNSRKFTGQMARAIPERTIN